MTPTGMARFGWRIGCATARHSHDPHWYALCRVAALWAVWLPLSLHWAGYL